MTLPQELIMRRMDFEDGRVGYYIDHQDFYCDIERDLDEIWSVFFRDKDSGKEGFAEHPPAYAPVLPTTLTPKHFTKEQIQEAVNAAILKRSIP